MRREDTGVRPGRIGELLDRRGRPEQQEDPRLAPFPDGRRHQEPGEAEDGQRVLGRSQLGGHQPRTAGTQRSDRQEPPRPEGVTLPGAMGHRHRAHQSRWSFSVS